ncbi:MAG: hypothetical protein K0Q59_2084 [Paenibacillus sp.]|nr:hypothetical protein [Paenibacillus sp.]
MRLQPGLPQEAGMSPTRIQHLEQMVEGWAHDGVSQAFVTVVARRGIIVSHQAVGKAGPDADAPAVTKETLFPLSSVTKPFTATAAMILVDRGLLCISFPVSHYIPEFVGEGKERVLVHQLMTHTSGLRNSDVSEHIRKKEGTVQVPPPEPTQHPDLHRRLYLGYDAPLWKPAGTEMSYCSYGVELLGEIVRRVSGQSLEQFCRDNIFEPIGMRDTFFVVPQTEHERVIRRSPDVPGGGWYHSPEALSRPSAAGGAYSTALDIAKFGQMFLNKGTYGEHRILSAAAVTEMTRDQVPDVSATYGAQFFKQASYGYCWPVNGNKKDSGDLFSAQALVCGGAGGVNITIDPGYDTVHVYFSIDNRRNDGYGVWCPTMNLFHNAGIAAIED